jgi:hypothetical protein
VCSSPMGHRTAGLLGSGSWVHQAVRVRDVMVYTEASVRVRVQLGGFGLVVVKHRVRLPNLPTDNASRSQLLPVLAIRSSVTAPQMSALCRIRSSCPKLVERGKRDVAENRTGNNVR